MKLHPSHGIVCLLALRHSFKRPYMASIVTEYIKDNWKHFKNQDKFLFIRDTEQAIKDHFELDISIGDECDLNTYQTFLQWMKDATQTP